MKAWLVATTEMHTRVRIGGCSVKPPKVSRQLTVPTDNGEWEMQTVRSSFRKFSVISLLFLLFTQKVWYLRRIVLTLK